MLGSESLSVRLAGIYSLEWLAKEDPEQYHIQIMQSFCSFATNPAGDYESNQPPADNVVNSDQATRQDVRAVMYALGKRSESENLWNGRLAYAQICVARVSLVAI